MEQKKRHRSTAFSKDKEARTQVALMRMAGFSARRIAEETGRHIRSIEAELRRTEHYKLIRRLVIPVAKKRLPEKKLAIIEHALKKREVANE